MNAPLLIKAAMRSADHGYLADQMQRLEAAGVDGLHFDVMDGRFVPELCMGPLFIRGLRKYSALPFEVHLLVQEPEKCLEPYLEAGANSVLVHVEASQDPAALLARIRACRCHAGLALAPATPASAVMPYLSLCQVVNVMLVTPGQPGVLQEAGVENLSALAEAARRTGDGPLIQADGAVSMATRDRLVAAGAQAMVAGYPIFSQQDFGAAVSELRDALSMRR